VRTEDGKCLKRGRESTRWRTVRNLEGDLNDVVYAQGVSRGRTGGINLGGQINETVAAGLIITRRDDALSGTSGGIVIIGHLGSSGLFQDKHIT
jgi:hypothetical protein